MALSLDRCVAPLLAALVACTPALDWREVRIDDAALLALFPCRPQRRMRDVSVAGATVQLEIVACGAEGSTFAVGHFAASDPARVTDQIDELRRATIANVGATEALEVPFPLAGATPNRAAGRLRLSGKMPDGAVVREHAVFFVRGLRIYQVSVIGAAPPPAAVENFIANLKFAP
ncbi:MAG: hypothetical protein ABI809_04305 [Caldimonas sp.]